MVVILNVFHIVTLLEVHVHVDYPMFKFWFQKFLLVICGRVGRLLPVLICWQLMALHLDVQCMSKVGQRG